jgi:hypothetical protein
MEYARVLLLKYIDSEGIKRHMVVMEMLKYDRASVDQASVDDATSSMLLGELDSLPAVLDLPEAATLLGIGRTMAYQLVHSGDWPTPVLRVGRLIKIPTGPLVALLRGQDIG